MEALAQALAEGLSLPAATKKAGYSRQYGMTRQRAERDDLKARVEEIKAEQRAADADLRPVIQLQLKLAAGAEKINTASALVAARGLLADAAELKGRLAGGAPTPERPPMPPRLTTEEWIEKYSSKD